MQQNILVVAAHPDDEILGCGGAIARHADQGDAVHVLILAEGLTSRTETRDRQAHADDLEKLADAAEKANQIAGSASLELKAFPDNRMDSVDLLDVVKVVEAYLATHRPTIVYTHLPNDVNVDHRITHEAVVTACRPIPGHTVQTLLFFETASSTEWQTAPRGGFVPNWFVDISTSIDRKLAALEAYSGEMRQWPHPRSLEAVANQARYRGASVGVEAAEAFLLGRRIVGR